MSSAIIVRCPGCAARIRAPFQLVGLRRQCPGCGALFVIRPQAPPDLGPVFIKEEPRLGEWHQPARPASV